MIEGLATIDSGFGHAETLTRLHAAIRANGMQVLARLDQAAGPWQEGASLDATTVVMFGNRERQTALVKALRLMALTCLSEPSSGRTPGEGLGFIQRLPLACEALRGRSRGRVPLHGYGCDDRWDRQKSKLAAVAESAHA